MKSAFLALTALALPTFAAQTDQSVTLERSQLDVRVKNVWPSGVHRGWMPVRLEVHNRSELPQLLEILGNSSSFQSQYRYRADFSLAAGERVATELLLPAAATWNASWMLRLHTDRGDDSTLDAGAIGGSEERLSILAVSEEPAVESVIASWSERTSKRVLHGQWSPTGTTGANDDVTVAKASFADLPRSASAYTSLDLVLVDARRELPPDAQLEPLMAWVRSGGTALIAGPRGADLAQQRGPIAPWMEERFRYASEERHIRTCGLGTLAFHASDEWFEDPALRETAYELAQRDTDAAPSAASPGRTAGANPKIPDSPQSPNTSSRCS